MSHHKFAAVLDKLHPSEVLNQVLECFPGVERSRQSSARHASEEREAVRLEAGFPSATEGRRSGERVEQRQIPPHRRHDPDAAVLVAEPGVDVHTPHEQFPYGLLVGHGKLFVAMSGCDDLVVPCREGMGGCGHDPRAVLRRRVDDQSPGLHQGRANVLNGCTNPGGGFDLGPEEFRHNFVIPAVLVAILEDAGVGIGQKIARSRIDQEELLLDAQCNGTGDLCLWGPSLYLLV